MTRILPSLALLATIVQAPAPWSYPPTKTGDVTDTYFGKPFKDPYRWLETLKDKDVEAWFKAQADLTDGVLAKIPARDALANEWMALDKLKPASYSQITYEHGRVFYKKTLGGENVGKLYYRDGWKGTEQLLFDPAGFTPSGAKPGDIATIVNYTPSPDGRHVVLALSAAGAEYSELRPLEVESRKLLPETIYPSYGALSWTMDSKSFLYDAGKVTDIKSPEIELNRKTRLHAELPALLEDPLSPSDGIARDPRRYSTWLNSRPDASECAAVEMLARLAAEFGARIHIVHLATATALPVIRSARAAGAALSVETCPHYLTLAAEDIVDGATAFKCAPPIRSRDNRERLWTALTAGEIDLIATDHSPAPPGLKHLDDGDFVRAWGGIASLQLGLSIVWTGAAERGIPVERVVACSAGG